MKKIATLFLSAGLTTALGGCEPRPPNLVEPGASPSTSSLAINEAGAILYVALPDHDEVRAVDAATGVVRGRVEIPGHPHRLTVLGDGRVAVTARYAGTLSVIDPSVSEVLSVVEVGADPFGVLEVGDDIVVALAGQDELAFVSKAAPLMVGRRIALLESEPRGLALTPKGELYVSHYKRGALSRVDLALGVPDVELHLSLANNPAFEAKQLEALTVTPSGDAIVTPHQECNNDPEQFGAGGSLSGTATAAYYATGPTGFPAVVPTVSRVDTELGVHLEDGPGPFVLESLGQPEPPGRVQGVINPVDEAVVGGVKVNAPVAVALADGGRIELVVNRGSGNVIVRRSVLEAGQRSIVASVDVGVGAESIVLSPDGTLAYVFNPLSSEIIRFKVPKLETPMASSLGGAGRLFEGSRVSRINPEATMRVAESVLSADVERGRVLFNSVMPELSSLGTISCASCHPGGQDDGTTWSFAQGPRQTPALWGDLSETEPYHWDQTLADMDAINDFTVRIRMGGSGLGRRDVEALAAYIDTIPAPATALVEPDASVARGRDIFFSPSTGCASCHGGTHFTDNLAHYVGTGMADVDGETMDAFATPSLLGLARTAPYLHDGSARDLRELVDKLVVTDRMGTGSHLSDADVDDLVAFLRSL